MSSAKNYSVLTGMCIVGALWVGCSKSRPDVPSLLTAAAEQVIAGERSEALRYFEARRPFGTPRRLAAFRKLEGEIYESTFRDEDGIGTVLCYSSQATLLTRSDTNTAAGVVQVTYRRIQPGWTTMATTDTHYAIYRDGRWTFGYREGLHQDDIIKTLANERLDLRTRDPQIAAARWGMSKKLLEGLEEREAKRYEKERDVAVSRPRQKTILENLRQLAAAADQFYLEYGKDSATWDDLVGPEKFIREVISLEGETYPKTFKQREALVAVRPNGKNITFSP